MPSPSNVNQYLLPTDYPASKDELVRIARQRGAPEDVVSSLDALPARTYERQQELFDHAEPQPGADMGNTGERGVQ